MDIKTNSCKKIEKAKAEYAKYVDADYSAPMPMYCQVISKP